MGTEIQDLGADRELDAMVAERVMGLTLAGRMCAAFVEGEWSLHPESTPDGWLCHAEEAPVYVRHCICERGPAVIGPGESEADAVIINAYNAQLRREYEAQRERWGHTDACLEVVPDYSTSISDAFLVVEHLRAEWERDYTDDAPKRMKPFWTFVDCNEEGWRADISLGTDDGDVSLVFQSAPTLPHAICRTALVWKETR